MANKILTLKTLTSTIDNDGLVYDWIVLALLSDHFKKLIGDSVPYKKIVQLIRLRFSLGLLLFILLLTISFDPQYLSIICFLTALTVFIVTIYSLKKQVITLAPSTMDRFIDESVENLTLFQFAQHVKDKINTVPLFDYFDLYEKTQYFLIGGSFVFFVFIYPVGLLRGIVGMSIAFLLCRFITFHIFLLHKN